MLLAGYMLFLLAASEVPVPGNAMPVSMQDAWTVKVGPGEMMTPDSRIKLDDPVFIAISPVDTIKVTDEVHSVVIPFNQNAGGWRRGNQLNALITQECTATGALIPNSVRIKSNEGPGTGFTYGVDYLLDREWGTFGRMEGGRIGPGQAVFVDYEYRPNRLDSIVINSQGAVRVLRGRPGLGVVLPPSTDDGDIVVCNVWQSGVLDRLTQENLFPVGYGDDSYPPRPMPFAETLLPRTLAKLRNGDPVTIVAWGDSVTHGGGVQDDPDKWYQQVFLRQLQERFPNSNITLHSAAWPGANSVQYMNAPRNGEYDFQRDVIARRPDLVTVNFVNDGGMHPSQTKQHYNWMLQVLREAGAEIIFITPHLVRPDWMPIPTLRPLSDPRPYVHALRELAAENDVAYADAAEEWVTLWRRGIPHVSMLANSINHPDERGHEIFARSLMRLFPGR